VGTAAPPPDTDIAGVWDGRPCTLADVTALRLHLRAGLADCAATGGGADADIERLLLAFEELTSNGVRHGRAPVRVQVITTGSGWLIDVSDAAADRPPTPAVGRDAADGGLGLYLVARLSAAHGWHLQHGHKHVWARIDRACAAPPEPADSLPAPRRVTPARPASR
jgi:anti-sigma regulatory factor (Ser/Thr protein kinase)